MRVLHVIGPLSTGGAQTQLLGLVRAAHLRHWDATVVGTSGGSLADEFRDLGCTFIQLERRGSPGLLRMRALRRIVRDGDFDVIHGNLWQSNLYCRVAVIGRRNRPAVVISERNVEATRGAWRRLLDFLLAVVTDAYVGNTEAVSDFIRDAHPVGDRELATIPNAVDTLVFKPANGTDRGSRPVRIGSVGRLDVEKGFDVLIDAIRVLDRQCAVEARIAGEGPERASLERRAQDLPVTLLGSLTPGVQVASFLQQLDVFVLPSTFREGRPNVILEAVTVGLPVVATDIDGMREILRGPTLVAPGDARALADAIQEAIRDPEEWIYRSDATNIDGFDTLASRYREVFARALTRAKSSSSRDET